MPEVKVYFSIIFKLDTQKFSFQNKQTYVISSETNYKTSVSSSYIFILPFLDFL